MSRLNSFLTAGLITASSVGAHGCKLKQDTKNAAIPIVTVDSGIPRPEFKQVIPTTPLPAKQKIDPIQSLIKDLRRTHFGMQELLSCDPAFNQMSELDQLTMLVECFGKNTNIDSLIDSLKQAEQEISSDQEFGKCVLDMGSDSMDCNDTEIIREKINKEATKECKRYQKRERRKIRKTVK